MTALTPAEQDPPRIRVHRDGRVLTIVLNRPDRGNALDLAFADGLAQAMDGLDDRVGCLLLRGEGRNFCVGGDITTFDPGGDPEAAVGVLARNLHDAIRLLDGAPVPVVAAVHGGIGGAGVSLAAVCDVVISTRTARFRPAYLALGVTPDGGLTWTLPRAIGTARALDVLMTDGTITAEQALDWGLVSRLVDEDDLEPQARAVADRLAAGPTQALVRVRRLVRDGQRAGLSDQLDAEASSIAHYAGTAPGREGITAFLERRPPRFQPE